MPSLSKYDEIFDWRRSSTDAINEVKNCVRETTRSLNGRAESIRMHSVVRKNEVRSLNIFEKEDMENDLDKHYDKILERQKKLPDISVLKTEELQKMGKDIEDILRIRVNKDTVLGIAYGIIAVIVTLALPALYFAIKDRSMYKTCYMIFVPLCLMIIILLAMQLCFLWNRHRLRKKIKKYNKLLNNTLYAIEDNESAYNEFIKDIVYYSKGCKYTRLLKEKEDSEDSMYYAFNKHLKAIDLYNDRLQMWGKAHFLDLVYDGSNPSRVYMNINVSPVHSTVYTFENGNEYEAGVNTCEGGITSPFEFVDRLLISREEIVDDT